mgnify:CR=1 FL=1
MICVRFYRDSIGQYRGFAVKGHAGYGVYGSDIVCAAVSALSINAANSIEYFSSDRAAVRTEEEAGILFLRLDTQKDETSQLFLKSLELGLKSIQKQYGSKYLKILYKEV